jgi:hypothetical protein
MSEGVPRSGGVRLGLFSTPRCVKDRAIAPAGMTVGDFVNLADDPDVLSVSTSVRRARAG